MKCAIIGCGKMGTALAAGAIRAGALMANDVTGCDTNAASMQAFAEATGAKTSTDVVSVVEASDVIILCVKPQDAIRVIGSFAGSNDGTGKLLISVVAGLSSNLLEDTVPSSWRVIRSMPNTPALVGKAATAFCKGERATDVDADFSMKFFSSVGLALEVSEHLINAVTGLSGSGPAYGFICIEALADGGVACGLPREQAMKLAAQTLLGAATMVMDTGMHPGVLKDAVASPNGTTIAAIEALEKGGLRSALISAVIAAVKRADEMGTK